MQATTILPLTLPIIFVRWLLTTILKPLMSWTIVNIQVEDVLLPYNHFVYPSQPHFEVEFFFLPRFAGA